MSANMIMRNALNKANYRDYHPDAEGTPEGLLYSGDKQRCIFIAIMTLCRLLAGFASTHSGVRSTFQVAGPSCAIWGLAGIRPRGFRENLGGPCATAGRACRAQKPTYIG